MFSKLISKVIGEKRRWRQYKARVRQLPPRYRMAVDAVERYLMYLGPGSGDVSMFEDLVDLFEQSAASGTSVRAVVGADPVEFIETFAQNYPEGQWRIRVRERLITAIERADAEDTGEEERAV